HAADDETAQWPREEAHTERCQRGEQARRGIVRGKEACADLRGEKRVADKIVERECIADGDSGDLIGGQAVFLCVRLRHAAPDASGTLADQHARVTRQSSSVRWDENDLGIAPARRSTSNLSP